MSFLRNRKTRVAIAFLALAVVVFLLLPLVMPPLVVRTKPLSELLANHRSKAGLPLDQIVRNLEIKPGMQVLDLGAGEGELSFALARVLAGSGSVFAAEFDSGALEMLSRKARELGLTNLVPVKMKTRWDSEFYRDKRFDMVVLDDVYERLPNPELQLSELKQILNGPPARLVLLRTVFLPPFDPSMNCDVKKILEILRKHGSGSPFYSRLSADLRKVVIAPQPLKVIDDPTRGQIIEFLNTCLNDQGLYEDLDRYYSRGTKVIAEYMKEVKRAPDAHLFQYFLYNFAPAFDKGATPVNPRQQFAVYTANHLLLTCIFSLPRDCPFYTEVNFYRPDRVLEETFQKSGFRVTRQEKLSPAHSLWEFTQVNQ